MNRTTGPQDPFFKPRYFVCDFNFAFGKTGFDGVPDLVEKKGYLVNVYRGQREQDGSVTYRSNDGDSFDYSKENAVFDFAKRLDINFNGTADFGRFYDLPDIEGRMSTYLACDISANMAPTDNAKEEDRQIMDINKDGRDDVVETEADNTGKMHNVGILTSLSDELFARYKIKAAAALK